MIQGQLRMLIYLQGYLCLVDALPIGLTRQASHRAPERGNAAPWELNWYLLDIDNLLHSHYCNQENEVSRRKCSRYRR